MAGSQIKIRRRFGKNPYQVDELRPLIQGRALEIAERVADIPSSYLSGQPGPCPKCGGTDRWRFNAEKGFGICNQCFSAKNGDVFALIAWYRDITFPEAVRLIGDYLFNQRTESQGQPRRGAFSKFPEPVEMNETLVAKWCNIKGVSQESFFRNGGQFVRSFGKLLIGFPAFTVSQKEPVRWIVYDINGQMIQHRSGESKVGTRLAFEDAPPGMAGQFAWKYLQEADLIWKVEGMTDLLALFNAIPTGLRTKHLVLTNSCGAGERPQPETLEPFRDKTVYVVPDADKAGEVGGMKWAQEIATVAREVRLLSLPFDGLDGKKDLRDFFQSGGQYGDFV